MSVVRVGLSGCNGNILVYVPAEKREIFGFYEGDIKMDIWHGELMGQAFEYVRTDCGRYLYRQKRHLGCKAFAKMLYKAMLTAGFSHDDIQSKWTEIYNRNNYCNKEFYRPVHSIVQEQVELAG